MKHTECVTFLYDPNPAPQGRYRAAERMHGTAAAASQPHAPPTLMCSPNPVRDRTTVRFRVQRPGRVQLVLYDQLGSRVKLIVDSVQQVGVHSVLLDVETLASGVYFLHYYDGENAYGKRLIVIR
jgi:hypothetical protein